jgi:hypothetical protein
VNSEGKLSYRTALGAIGAYLDRQRYQELVLCELEEGYVIRARVPDGSIEAVALTFPELRELADRANSNGDAGGAPQGKGKFPSLLVSTAGVYLDFLAALGRQCDLLGASTLSVLELADHVLVLFQRRVQTGDLEWREYIYDVPGIQQLLFSSGVPIGPARR